MLPAGVESFSGPISVTAFEISCSAGRLRQIPLPSKDTTHSAAAHKAKRLYAPSARTKYPITLRLKLQIVICPPNFRNFASG